MPRGNEYAIGQLVGGIGGALWSAYRNEKDEEERRKALQEQARFLGTTMPEPEDHSYWQHLAQPGAGRQALDLQQKLLDSYQDQLYRQKLEENKQRQMLQRQSAVEGIKGTNREALETQQQVNRSALSTQNAGQALNLKNTPQAITPAQTDAYTANAAANNSRAQLNNARAAQIPEDMARKQNLAEAFQQYMGIPPTGGTAPGLPPTGTPGSLPEWGTAPGIPSPGATPPGAPPFGAGMPGTSIPGSNTKETSVTMGSNGQISVTARQKPPPEIPAAQITSALAGFGELGAVMEDIGKSAGEVSQWDAFKEKRKQAPGVMGTLAQLTLGGSEEVQQMGLNIASMKNALVRITTGLAMSAQEEERILEEIPSMRDFIGDPSRFGVRLDTSRTNITRKLSIRLEALRAGGYYVPDTVDKALNTFGQVATVSSQDPGEDLDPGIGLRERIRNYIEPQ